jgi:glycosyltransferase involved in cell wall biosynthesis
MKIAIVGLFPKDPTIIRGGVEAVTLRLCEGLSHLGGFEIHAVVSSPHYSPGVTPFGDKWTVHSVGSSSRGGNLLFALPDRRRIARALHRIRPDLVHAHGTERHALGSLDASFPSVITIHGIIEEESRLERSPRQRVRGSLRNRVARRVVRKARNVIVISPYVAELYRERLSHARTWTIENPVGERFFEVSPAETGETVLFSGVIIPRKALENLIDAAAKARKEVPALRLRIAGPATDPAYLSALKRRVEQAGMRECVSFLGGLSPEELAKEYGRSAFVALPSHQETAPVAVQEAMAAGKPVIGSDAGGIPHQIRHGETGFVVPTNDIDQLAGRMVELLQSEELRRRMGVRARDEARSRFSVESVAARTKRVYEEILGEAGR